MATVAAARSILRSTTIVRSAAAKAASASKSARSPFRIPTTTATTPRIFRCPVELSACLDTLQPFHSATASALMTSMLSMSRSGFGWVPEDSSDDTWSSPSVGIQMLTSIDCHRRDEKIRVFMGWIAATVYDNLAIRSCEAFAGGVDRMC